MLRTRFKGTDIGALQLPGVIQATPVSPPGLGSRETGTQGLVGGPLVSSDCFTTCKILGGGNFIVGKQVQEISRGGREHGHHMGMGHGFKKLAKMVFAPRLPQDRRGGGKASADSNQSHDSIVPPSIAMTLSHPGAHCRVSERQTPLCCIQDKTLT